MSGFSDSLRAEFPSLARAVGAFRLPAVAQEPAPWAVVSALGASLLVASVLRLVLFVAPSSLQAPSFPLPLGATWNSIITLASHVVAGAVLLRAGGRAALWWYAGLVALQVATSLPGILLFCDRSGGQLGMQDGGCNVPLLYVAAGRAPEWIGVAIGALLSRSLPARGPGANVLLRGAGAYWLALIALATPLGMLSSAGRLNDQIAQTLLYVTVNIVAAAIAGFVLRRARFAAALLVALAIIGPGLGFAVPLVRNGGPDAEPLSMTLARWSSVLASAGAGGALVLAWVIGRRRGTFF
ncbi:MAG TPA: hypothetical protein VEP48_02645 [Methylomirabilota bacterium]|nr:hypothetical protein [Methylomirabilota bacterium]